MSKGVDSRRKLAQRLADSAVALSTSSSRVKSKRKKGKVTEGHQTQADLQAGYNQGNGGPFA